MTDPYDTLEAALAENARAIADLRATIDRLVCSRLEAQFADDEDGA